MSNLTAGSVGKSTSYWVPKSKILLAYLCITAIFLGVAVGQFANSAAGQARLNPKPIDSASPAASSLNTRIAIDPYSIIDLQRTLSDVVFTVNITNTPSINGFAVVLSYNYKILHAKSLDSTGNILTQIPGQSEAPYRDCLDGTPGPGGQGECTVGDGPGVTAFADTSVGPNLTPNNSSGTIFTLDLTPVTAGFSQILIKQAFLTNGNSTFNPQVTTFSGYFTSIDCPSGSGVPCKPSSPDFTWSPKLPAAGKPVVFYGNLSKTPTGVSIIDYKWYFGDRSTDVYIDTKQNSTGKHTFSEVGGFLVTLTINDTYYISTAITHLVVVHSEHVEVGIRDIKVEPGTVLIIPGTTIRITAFIHNYGAKRVNDTATLTLDGKLLNQTTIINLNASAEIPITAVWDTSKVVPNAYRLDAYVPPVQNQTDTTHNLKTVWIQIILPGPGGLGMWPTAGIGISVLGAVGYGLSRFRRRGIPLEPL